MSDEEDDARVAVDPADDNGFYCNRPEVSLAERRRIYWLIQAQFDARIPPQSQVEFAAQWSAFVETGEVPASAKIRAVK